MCVDVAAEKTRSQDPVDCAASNAVVDDTHRWKVTEKRYFTTLDFLVPLVTALAAALACASGAASVCHRESLVGVRQNKEGEQGWLGCSRVAARHKSVATYSLMAAPCVLARA